MFFVDKKARVLILCKTNPLRIWS